MQAETIYGESLQDLVRCHGRAVQAVARRLVGDSSLAEEIAQDTFIAIWSQPERFDPTRGTVRALLLGIARNKAIDLWRRQQGVRRAEVLAADVYQDARTPRSEDAELREELRRALTALPYTQREAIYLAYFEGWSYREVARELGVPEGTAKSRLRQALSNLRSLLTPSRVDLAS